MSDLPKNLKYTAEHEWLRLEEDGAIAVIGITDYAQASLGDVTFVELPDEGATLGKGDSFGVVESVKAASDLYMPVSGEVIGINDTLEGAPETVNQDPYGEAWMIKVRLSDPGEVSDLLAPEQYQELL